MHQILVLVFSQMLVLIIWAMISCLYLPPTSYHLIIIQIEGKIDDLGKEDNPNDSAAEGETASRLSWSRSIILVILKVFKQYQTAPRLGVYAWLDSASRAEEYQSLQ